MLRLRLTQSAAGANSHRVQVDLDSNGVIQSAVSVFQFALSEQDREDLRWYLEDYLEYPIEPAPSIAARVEQRQAELGRSLFGSIFAGDARDLWATLRDRLSQVRVEVIGEVKVDAVLPWELLRDPRTDVPLALGAGSFVRAQHQTAQRPQLPEISGGESIRVLLVICRPAGHRDVPFRSVASHLVRLSAGAREVFQLDVLRPPTFRQLDAVLRAASRRGEPYHVVHFDGHGAWVDLAQAQADGSGHGAVSPLHFSVLSPPRLGDHGYLVFEDPDSEANEQFVDGPALGRLLVETGVGVLVLNACRSAHADPTPTPDDVDDGSSDVHARVRAYGSLAQEVVDAGVAGVVAMRYNVWVVTAAQFVGDLYASLLQGDPLGEAGTAGRKQLAAHPVRAVAFTPRPLQDWMVPVVYEAAPVELFSKPAEAGWAKIILGQDAAAGGASRLDARLPGRPDVGFFGRDETLLALDRAFDSHQVVLLSASAGAGKTTTAAEFARWYALTGGVQGPVLFTSFERHLPLARVLDQLGEAFEPVLEANDIHWLALTDQQRREVAGQLLNRVTVLWIWDNVEPVTGFPAGSDSAWSSQEQQELAGFLRQVRDSKAKVLLTSRRDERAWLGELPARVVLPAMPMTERVQLARAVADKRGRRLTEVEDWQPLLDYTQGNPLTVTVLVGQALTEGIRTRQQVEGFVARLQAGEATLADDEQEGRTRSLGASLGYGFQQAFTDAERVQLALLHLFQGFVYIDVLRTMGDPKFVDEPVAAIRGLTREAGVRLLDRAAEVGLLASYGGGYYGIHPALPWYFQGLFTQTHGPGGSPAALAATHAYTGVMARLGTYYHVQYNEGRQDVIGVLQANEANLLHARRLARLSGRWGQVIGAMQGLRALYEHAGRGLEWARLVDELVPDLVDPATDGPLPGREDQWDLITEYRVRLAQEQRDLATAERLQGVAVARNRERASGALNTPPEALNAAQRGLIRSLAASVGGLGIVLRQQNKPECVELFKEALELSQRLGNRELEGKSAYNLGTAYEYVPSLRDLDMAERWYQHDLSVVDDNDRLGRARTISALGHVRYDRFRESRGAEQPHSETLAHLNAALAAYHEALALTPADAIRDRASIHNALGAVYAEAGKLDQALTHSRESIRYDEQADNRYGAGKTRHNVALLLGRRARYEEALLWAEAALRDFESYGDRAIDDTAVIQEMIIQFQQARAGGQA